ncbi:MAG: tetratricopeptide repeat protein [Akkermansiaceae bacterium]
MKHIFTFTLISILSFLLNSCGSDVDETLPLVGTARLSAGPAHAAYEKALASDQAGKSKKAQKLYDRMADNYPTATDAPQARFRQAQLLEQRGDFVEAFDAYSEVVSRYQSTSLYSPALERQIAISQLALDGKVKSGFIFGSKIDSGKLVEMLGKVRDSAPKAPSAPKAQFQIGQVYEGRKKVSDAITAYRKVVSDWPDSNQAPEAQFLIGKILIEQAKRGNQDMSNLDRAREAFQDYLTVYPRGSRAGEAREQISTLSQQDVQRSLDVANFYKRKGDRESAMFYYQEVLKRHGSGALHDQAKAGLDSLTATE